MLNKIYNILNTVSVTAWIFVIYVIKEEWTFDSRVHPLFVSAGSIVLTIGIGVLSLFLTKFLGKENLEKCKQVELADASFVPAYIGYFLVAFEVSDDFQLILAIIFITIISYFVRWQYFNLTYMLFGYHYYHVTTDAGTKLFIICRKEIRTPDELKFHNLRRINNTTYIDKGS